MNTTKHFISICFGLLLAHFANAQALSGFSVYEREFRPIDDATVTVNGVLATYRNGFGYQYPADLKPPYKVVIEREGFLPTIMEGRAKMGGEYYLRRPDEDYFYFGDVPQPCLRTPGWLLIAAKEYDEQGKKLDAKLVRTQIEALVARHGFVIVREQKIFGMDSPMTPLIENQYLIRPQSDSNMISTRDAIVQFWNEPSLNFSGPAILTSEEGTVLSAYPYVDLCFETNTEISKIRNLLRAYQYIHLSFDPYGNPTIFRVDIGFGDLDYYNKIVESLWTLPGITHARIGTFQFIN